jgi:predicted TIM-barrel fold metal-dependent hydrolase
MKIITIEEHFQIAEIKQAVAKYFPGQSASHLLGYTPPDAPLEDLGTGRLQRMDAMGIDVQVLSYTPAGLPAIPAAEAVPLAREINDQLTATIQTHPDRFAGFATLPTSDPKAAAAELERAVQKLGLKGAMIGGRTNGLFLDDPLFQPILEAAAALEVPIYLHPSYPPKAVQDACYAGLDPAVSARFATAGWGWHLETGTHALHMILAGVFDRYPSLQLILGHWGEMIPFFLDRFAEMLTQTAKHLQRPIADYFLQQVYVTPSGMFTLPQFLLTLQVMGADRIMYAVDYPYGKNEHGRTFLEQAPISPTNRAKIAHGNAEKVLKLALK